MVLATEEYIKFKADSSSSNYLKYTLEYLEDFVIHLEELKEKNYSNDKFNMIIKLHTELQNDNVSSSMKIVAFMILINLNYHKYEFKEVLAHHLKYTHILTLDVIQEVYN